MSYTIRLIPGPPCSTCGRTDDSYFGPDPTYNLEAIFDLALTGEDLPNPTVLPIDNKLWGVTVNRPRGLCFLSGLLAGNTISILKIAISRLADKEWEARFKALEDPNGWGTLEGAQITMARLLKLAEEYPSHRWDIC